MNTSGAATVLLPRVDYPEKRMDMKTVALWLMAGLLVLNLGVTALLLVNMDSSKPEEVEQRVKVSVLAQELARLKSDTEKSLNHSSRVFNQLQLDTDTMRAQIQTLNAIKVDNQKGTGRSYDSTPTQSE